MSIQCSRETIKRAVAMARQIGIKKGNVGDQLSLARAIATHYGQELPARHSQAKQLIESFVGANQDMAKPAASLCNIPAKLRYEVLLKYGGRCQCCGLSPLDGIVLHVDHIKPVSKHPELSFNIGNLQVLCRLCNQGKAAWDETDWRTR